MSSFDISKSYRIGRRKAGSNAMKIIWTRKPAPKVYTGSYFLETLGVREAAEFWRKNPLDMELGQTFVISEIEPGTGDDIYFSEGTFVERREQAAPTLADVPRFSTESDTRNAAQMERMHNERIVDLKEQLTRAEERLIEQDKQMNKMRDRYDAELAERDKQIEKLSRQVAEMQMDLRIEKAVNERLDAKLNDDSTSLQDGLSSLATTFQEPLKAFMHGLGTKTGDLAMSFMNKRSKGPQPIQSSNEVIPDAAEELGLPAV